MLKVRNYKQDLLYDLKVSNVNSVEIKKLKKGEKPSIMSDTMFKTMFFHTNRLKYSAKLLSYYLDISYEELLSSIVLTKNELDKEKENSKGERSDYVAIFDNTRINIEVNNNSSLEVMERNMEYAHRLYAEKVKVSSTYSYNQVIQLNLNNFSFEGNDKIVDIYSVQNKEGLVLNNKLIFIQIYIPNLRRKWYTLGIENLDESERYLLALVEPSIEFSKELGGSIKIMEEYIEEADEVIKDVGFGESYDKEWALQDEAERRGREEGLTQGREEQNLENAKKMKEKGFDKKVISEITGLTIEEIERIS